MNKVGILGFTQREIAPFVGEAPVTKFSFLSSLKDIQKESVIVTFGVKYLIDLSNFSNLESVHGYCVPSFIPNITIIPTFDAEAIRVRYPRAYWVRRAISKAVDVSNNPQLLTDYAPKIDVISGITELSHAISSFLHEGLPVSIDIETSIKQKHLLCLSVASKTRCIVVPFKNDAGSDFWHELQEIEIRKSLELLFRSSLLKVFHNFAFDCLYLQHFGFKIEGPICDTMIMSHWDSPEREKSLEDLGRAFLYCVPWKNNEWKSGKSGQSLWSYNGYDAIRTLECYEQLLEIIPNWNMEYFSFLAYEVIQACSRGWNIDHKKLKKLKTEKLEELELLDDWFQDYAKRGGFEVFNVNSVVQKKKLVAALGYKVPLKKGKECLDETNVKKLRIAHPDEPLFRQFLVYSELNTEVSRYCLAKFDKDKRLRFSFNIAGTTSGRWSSSQTPWGTGVNAQNCPAWFREVIIPDEGMTLFTCDLSQAELRIVAWLSQDKVLLGLLETNTDVHKYVADFIGKALAKALTRQFGKKVNHAHNYGMGAEKLKEALLLDLGLVLSLEECKEALRCRDLAFPGVAAWRQNIRSQVQLTRELKSTFGRRRVFYDRLLGSDGASVFRSAFSWQPQTEVGDVVNQLFMKLRQKDKTFQFLGQIHDELLLQKICNTNEEKEAFIKLIHDTASEVRVCVAGNSYSIPVDVHAGPNWKACKS